MKHSAIRPFETSRVPFSNIFVSNCFPLLSMKLTAVRSTETAGLVVDAAFQQRSSLGYRFAGEFTFKKESRNRIAHHVS